MSEKTKTVLRNTGTILAFALLIGAAAFILFIFGVFGTFPIYVTKCIPVLAAALFLAKSGAVLLPIQKKRIWMLFLCVCIGAAGYMGVGVYRNSLPTVDDRSLLLWQYEPFKEGTKAVSLEEPATLQFAANDLSRLQMRLRMDGATALYPVYASFVQSVFPEGSYGIYDFKNNDGCGQVACTGTIDAYERLIRNETDLVFAAAPSQEQIDAAAKAGKEFHLTPIGREAFVFFVNSKNPVSGLTLEEVQGIYSGQITNWSQVGGKRQSIRAFQRAQNSGSQTTLLRLMGDVPLMEPAREDVISPMDGIIRQVANYRNFSNALGFSFRFYATEMVSSDQIRFLALNGVLPTKETIRDNSYPMASEFYAVTAAPIGAPDPRETNPDLDAFLDWILSPQGQSLVEKSGYVPLYS